MVFICIRRFMNCRHDVVQASETICRNRCFVMVSDTDILNHPVNKIGFEFTLLSVHPGMHYLCPQSLLPAVLKFINSSMGPARSIFLA